MHAAPYYPMQPISMPAIGPSAPPAPARSDALLARLCAPTRPPSARSSGGPRPVRRSRADRRARARAHRGGGGAGRLACDRRRPRRLCGPLLAVDLDGTGSCSTAPAAAPPFRTAACVPSATSRGRRPAARPTIPTASSPTATGPNPSRSGTPSTERIVGGRELRRHVAQALEALPPAQRAVHPARPRRPRRRRDRHRPRPHARSLPRPPAPRPRKTARRSSTGSSPSRGPITQA